jgi:toxin-antitoxin system PIN domain toxin
MTFLPDVNVWLALVFEQHTHSREAQKFTEAENMPRLALCRVAQMGLLRLLTNASVMSRDVMSPAAAWKTLDLLMVQENIYFADEPEGLDDLWREETRNIASGSSFWTDAYLAAFASAAGYTVVTFDQGFAKYKKARVRILNRASS